MIDKNLLSQFDTLCTYRSRIDMVEALAIITGLQNADLKKKHKFQEFKTATNAGIEAFYQAVEHQDPSYLKSFKIHWRVAIEIYQNSDLDDIRDRLHPQILIKT